MLSSAKCCPIILWLNEASGEQQGVQGGGAFRKMHLFNSAIRSKDHLLCLGCPAIKKTNKFMFGEHKLRQWIYRE